MAEEVTGEGEFARFKQISPWREWEGCKKRYVYVVGSCAFKAQVVMKDDNEVAALIEWLGAKEECKEAKAEGDEVTVQFETQATMLKVEAALADNDLVESVTIAEEGRCEGMVIDRHLQCIVPAASVVHDETEHKNLLPLPKAVIMAQGYSAALTLGIPISNGFFVKIAASSCPTKRIVICPNPSISRLYTGEKFASEITNRVADLYQTRVTCIVPLFDKPPFKNPLSIFTVPASALSSEVVSAVTTVHPYVSMQAGAIISHDVWYDCRSRKIVADTERRVASNVAWASVNQIAADVTMLREAVLDSGLFGESEVPLLPVGVEAIAAEGKAKWTKEDCRTHLIARDSIQSILKTWSSANEAAASPSPAPTPTPTPAAAAAAPTSRVSTASTTNAPAAAPIPRKVAPPTAVKVPKRSLPPGSTLQHLLNTSHHNDAQSLRSAKVHLAALFRCQKYRSKEQGFLAIREYYDGNTCTFVVTVGNRQFAYVRGYPNKRHNLFLDSLKIAMRTAGATKLAADASSAEGQAPYLFNRVYALQYEKAPADTSREMNMDRDRERERDRERIEKIERERLEKDRMAERERDRERLERLEAERKHRLLERRRVEEMQV